MFGVYQHKKKVNGEEMYVEDMNLSYIYLRFATILRQATSAAVTFPNVKIISAGGVGSGTLLGTVTGNAAGLYYGVFLRGKGNMANVTLSINRTPTIGSVALGQIFRIAESDFDYTITLAGSGLTVNEIYVVGFSYDPTTPTFVVLS
jgi:hypothetical protein